MKNKDCNSRATILGAISRGFLQQVRFLIEFGANVNEKDQAGKTPLIYCSLVDDEKWGTSLARTLLEHGASAGLRDKKGLNALHYACVHERVNVVKVILGAPDFDLNKGDKFGNTALHYAATSGHVGITQMLVDSLNKYKLSLDKRNKQGVTPLIVAFKKFNFDCANIMLDGGADPEARDLVEYKTASEWHQEALASMDNVVIPTRIRSSPSRSMYSRGKRSLSGKSTSTKSRYSLAMFSSTQQSSQSAVTISSQEADLISPDTLPVTKDTDIPIRPASAKDPRNNPEYVFHTNAVKYFVNRNEHLPRSAGQLNREHKNELRDCWKSEVRNLYYHLQFQCSGSFRPTARTVIIELDQDVSGNSVSDAASDITSTGTTPRKLQRRTSLAHKGTPELKRRQSSQNLYLNIPKQRRPSSSNESSLRSSADSSSSESINTNASSTSAKPPKKKITKESKKAVDKDDSLDNSSDKNGGSNGSPKTNKSNISSTSTKETARTALTLAAISECQE